MISKVMALLGFGSRTDQATIPPLFGYLVLLACSYWAAVVIEAVTYFAEWLSWGKVSRESWSIGFRTFGVFAALLVTHGVIRIIVWGDDHSWGGWIRRFLRRDG